MTRLVIFLYFLTITTLALHVSELASLLVIFPLFLIIYTLAEDIDQEHAQLTYREPRL